MQSQASGCEAVLLVDLHAGTIAESCGDDTARHDAVARVIRELATPQQVILPRLHASATAADEAIVISDDHTFVCRRLPDRPHHALAAICRGTRSLGLMVSLLNEAAASRNER